MSLFYVYVSDASLLVIYPDTIGGLLKNEISGGQPEYFVMLYNARTDKISDILLKLNHTQYESFVHNTSDRVSIISMVDFTLPSIKDTKFDPKNKIMSPEHAFAAAVKFTTHYKKIGTCEDIQSSNMKCYECGNLAKQQCKTCKIAVYCSGHCERAYAQTHKKVCEDARSILT